MASIIRVAAMFLVFCFVGWNGGIALEVSADERPRIVRVPVDFKIQEKETQQRVGRKMKNVFPFVAGDPNSPRSRFFPEGQQLRSNTRRNGSHLDQIHQASEPSAEVIFPNFPNLQVPPGVRLLNSQPGGASAGPILIDAKIVRIKSTTIRPEEVDEHQTYGSATQSIPDQPSYLSPQNDESLAEDNGQSYGSSNLHSDDNGDSLQVDEKDQIFDSSNLESEKNVESLLPLENNYESDPKEDKSVLNAESLLIDEADYELDQIKELLDSPIFYYSDKNDEKHLEVLASDNLASDDLANVDFESDQILSTASPIEAFDQVIADAKSEPEVTLIGIGSSRVTNPDLEVVKSKLTPIFQEENFHNSHSLPRLTIPDTLTVQDDFTTGKPAVSQTSQDPPNQVLMLNHRADVQPVDRNLVEPIQGRNAGNLPLFPRIGSVKKVPDSNPISRRPIASRLDLSSSTSNGFASSDKNGLASSDKTVLPISSIHSSNSIVSVTQSIFVPKIEQVTLPSTVTISETRHSPVTASETANTIETKPFSSPKINNVSPQIIPRKTVIENKPIPSRTPNKKFSSVPASPATPNLHIEQEPQVVTSKIDTFGPTPLHNEVDHHHVQSNSGFQDSRLPRQGPVKNGDFAEEGLDIGAIALAGEKCIDKVIMVEETEYDDVVDCKHSYNERCHTTYTTDFQPQQEEDCEENFIKNCFIEYKKKANEEKVQFCHTPLICEGDGPVECKTVYESECQTRFHEHKVDDDVVDCETIQEEKCESVTQGYSTEQKCSKWPKQVCKQSKELVSKYSPETECKKVAKEICGPSGCELRPGPEQCFQKTEVVVQEVPEETCNLEPQRSCKQVTKLVPLLKAGEECVDIPKEVCSRSRTNPRKVQKPVVKKWCYLPTKQSGLAK